MSEQSHYRKSESKEKTKKDQKQANYREKGDSNSKGPKQSSKYRGGDSK